MKTLENMRKCDFDAGHELYDGLQSEMQHEHGRRFRGNGSLALERLV